MDEQDFETHGLRRRMVLMGGTAMAVAAPLGLLAAPSTAAAQTGAQPDWRFCAKCASMFWNGAADKGRCPAGGGHLAQGSQFAIHYDANRAGADQSQYDWRFCGKCKAMYWDGGPNKGRCPTGGGHLAQGFNFGLNFNNHPGGPAQSDWRFCDKCCDLFWNGAAGKGVCAAGGGHVAQGYVFAIPFMTGPVDPGKVIADAVGVVLPDVLTAVTPTIVEALGKANLLGKGYTLHKINLRFGKSNVSYHAPSFEISLTDSYLYTQVTQPSVLGSYADPAFEIHFDAVLKGQIQRLGSGKLQAQNVVVEITRILVKPRDVTGGIVTTVVSFFQMTGRGGRLIQEGMDRLKLDLTDRINGYLERFS
jgi:hypothetical protein